VQLHGNELSLTPKGELPRITGVVTAPGQLTLEPATISFFALPRAGNAACM
jgi:hypothetical protein